MNAPYRDIDELLQDHTDQQLETVGWEGLHARIDQHIAEVTQDSIPRIQWMRLTAAAAVVVLIIGLALMWFPPRRPSSILEQIQLGVIDTGPMDRGEPTGDALLASVDPLSILCLENVHVLTSDPLLQPHSVWDQQQVLKDTTLN